MFFHQSVDYKVAFRDILSWIYHFSLEQYPHKAYNIIDLTLILWFTTLDDPCFYREFMGIPFSTILLHPTIALRCCWSSIPIAMSCWLWLGLERSHYTCMVWFEGCSGPRTFFICEG